MNKENTLLLESKKWQTLIWMMNFNHFTILQRRDDVRGQPGGEIRGRRYSDSDR